MPTQNAERIDVTKVSEKGCTVQIAVNAPAEFSNSAFQDALVQVQSRVQLPGFRKGKAPISMVRDNFSAMIKERAFDNILRYAVNIAIEKHKINPVASPVLLKHDFDENKPFTAELEFEVPPSVALKNYKKIPMVSKKNEVTDGKINDAIKEVLEQNARLEPETDANAVLAETHFAIVDYKAFKEGSQTPDHSAKGELVDLSSPQTVKGLVDAIKGAKRGDTREFTSDTPSGKMRFEVSIVDIKKKTVPALDDAFAKEAGFENQEKLREHVRGALARQADEESRRETLRQLEDYLIKEHEFELPKSLVHHHIGNALERLMDRMLPEERQKMNEEQMKKMGERLRPAIERDMRVGYIMNAIAAAEKLEAGEADFDAEMEKALSRAATDEERLRVRSFFETRRGDIIATLTEHKVEDFLRKNAVITEA